jgi:hypothetical protein
MLNIMKVGSQVEPSGQPDGDRIPAKISPVPPKIHKEEKKSVIVDKDGLVSQMTPHQNNEDERKVMPLKQKISANNPKGMGRVGSGERPKRPESNNNVVSKSPMRVKKKMSPLLKMSFSRLIIQGDYDEFPSKEPNDIESKLFNRVDINQVKSFKPMLALKNKRVAFRTENLSGDKGGADQLSSNIKALLAP